MADVKRSRDAALGRCRKHPGHQQCPGVCSLCLGARLSRLSASASSSGKKNSSRRAPESSSSSSLSSVSPQYSSSSESSYFPTPSIRQRLGRLADEAKSGPLMLSSLFGGGKDGNLKKSRSMASNMVPKVAASSTKDEKVGRKKSGGFWWRLVNRRKKRTESGDRQGLKRSGTTVREGKVTT